MENSFVFTEFTCILKIKHSIRNTDSYKIPTISFATVMFTISCLIQVEVIYYSAEVEHIYRIINLN